MTLLGRACPASTSQASPPPETSAPSSDSSKPPRPPRRSSSRTSWLEPDDRYDSAAAAAPEVGMPQLGADQYQPSARPSWWFSARLSRCTWSPWPGAPGPSMPLRPAVRAVRAMAHSDTPPEPITSAAVPYRCWLLLAPPTRWLQAMLRNPEVTTSGWSPSLCRSASSFHIWRNRFDCTVAGTTLPPSKPPPHAELSSTSLQAKWMGVQSASCSAYSLA